MKLKHLSVIFIFAVLLLPVRLYSDAGDTVSEAVVLLPLEAGDLNPCANHFNEGTVTIHYDEGPLFREVFCEGGLADRFLREYWPDGTLMTEEYYVNGKIDGYSLKYYRNGQLRKRSVYANGEVQGEPVYYNQFGNVVKQDEKQFFIAEEFAQHEKNEMNSSDNFRKTETPPDNADLLEKFWR